MRKPGPADKFINLGKITTPYGAKTRYEGKHPGIDVANAKGTPIPSTVDGVVTNAISDRKPGENNFGNSVTLKDKAGNSHQFNHLQNVSAIVNQRVRNGQQIGTMGDSGSAYSPTGSDATHLDYRIVDAYGKYKNPTSLIKKV